MKSATNLHDKYKKYIKKRLYTLRFSGLFMSLVGLGMVAVQHFGLLSSIWNVVSILYICGILFTTASQYADLRMARKTARFMRVLALLFFLATLGMLAVILLDHFTNLTILA